MKIDHTIEQASKILSQYWPLSAFIAVNPLWDKTDQPLSEVLGSLDCIQPTLPISFYQERYQKGEITQAHLEQAIHRILGEQTDIKKALQQLMDPVTATTPAQAMLYCEQIGEYQYHPAKQWVREQCLHWLLYFFGQTNPSDNLMVYWLSFFNKEYPSLLNHAPTDSHELIAYLLKKLHIPETLWVTYIEHIFCEIYGWGSLIKWLKHHPENPWLSHQADLADLAAMWLCYEYHLQSQSKHDYQANTQQLPTDMSPYIIWQHAYELPYQEKLLQQLRQTAPKKKAARYQAVFCIDTRSEGMRRHLEKSGAIETFGYAGFFGLVFKLAHPDHHESSLQCPALIDPAIVIETQKKQQSWFSKTRSGWLNNLSKAKNHLLSPYALFEVLGIWSLLRLLGKNFFPQRYRHCSHKKPTINQHSFSEDLITDGTLSLEDVVGSAKQFLQTIGMTEFAETILLCAHRSVSENNPYAAALDCGACGGNSGVPNAIVTAQILNHPQVRAALNEQGLSIPEATRFIAACHNTTTDEIEQLIDQPDLSLQELLDHAGQGLRQERMQQLPGKGTPEQRATLWSELIPELGLANNAAMVIGPRWLTQEADLNRRVFLHSYEPEQDPNGDILEGIITAPVIVGHWINAQYFFSSVHPGQFGAGNKAIHNVVEGIGVMEGNLSDLKVGLPEQSVRYQDILLHEPRRLTVVIYAKQSRVDAILKKHPSVNNLVQGGWIHIVTLLPN